MKTVGIVGGLGPETTSDFYMKLIKLFRENCNYYPGIIIDSISFPFSIEEEIILQSKNEHKILPYLKVGVERLNRAGVDFIVIPCNTVHIFIHELRKISKASIVSILDETIRVVKIEGYKKIGLLATAKTIDSKLYEVPLKENDVDVIVPEKVDQDLIAKIILKILHGTADREDKKALIKITDNLLKRGSECIVLGCTDFQLILNRNDIKSRVIDTTDVLVSATFNKLST